MSMEQAQPNPEVAPRLPRKLKLSSGPRLSTTDLLMTRYRAEYSARQYTRIFGRTTFALLTCATLWLGVSSVTVLVGTFLVAAVLGCFWLADDRARAANLVHMEEALLLRAAKGSEGRHSDDYVRVRYYWEGLTILRMEPVIWLCVMFAAMLLNPVFARIFKGL